MSRDEWTVTRHAAGGLHVQGADEDGQRVSFRISRLDALDLAAALETTALRPVGVLRDTRGPRDEQLGQEAVS